jgi:hypothetical protein
MARSSLNSLSRSIYRAGRWTRNARAVQRAVQSRSAAPLFKRAARIGLGRALGRGERKIGL